MDEIFPKECLICSKKGDFLCGECKHKLNFIKSPKCLKCSLPYPSGVDHLCGDCVKGRHFEILTSLFVYDDVGKKLVSAFKFHGFYAVLKSFKEEIKLPEHDFIVPVPMTPRKKLERGYNQSERLARFLSEISGKPVLMALTKLKETPPQMSLPSSERRKNVKGVFRSEGRFKGKALLVDDVATTCSTADECAKALKRAGAERVFVFTLARAI